MDHITLLRPDEAVRLDSDQLGELYDQLGEAGAEDVVCRAMEELAARLTHAERLYRSEEQAEMRKNVRSLVGISEQIGMWSLARAAQNVINCIDAADRVALAATLARLLRIGEQSLSAVWDLQDLSI
ncbi:hypothetical protein [Thalassovita taeanensis]|uniref:Uncharacterized protein n=1 Tax=Thalassovita taeanensis TaxID=657014 RepID=A0A1H9DRY3_9RHOB|nr:hypothetical protein [Thalassovita taeanensis]SEQ16240.1 hypothetical protein SAMN04488092_104259 [Thalassovita taeanensis]